MFQRCSASGLKMLGKYFYNHEKILGLEISPHYIRICQMTNSYGICSLSQLASACMEKQFTNADIEQSQDIYVETLKSLLAAHKIKTKDTAISIPTSTSIIKILNMPDMEPEDLDQAASIGEIWESMVQLSDEINQYSVYYKILRRHIKPSPGISGNYDTSHEDENPPPKENAIISSLPDAPEKLPSIISESSAEDGNTMDVLFVATKFVDAMLYVDIAQRSGLRPIIIDVKCNAIKQAFETSHEKDSICSPYAILEFGADENYVYIIDNENVALFNIDVADEDRLKITQEFETKELLHDFVNVYATTLQNILDIYMQNNFNKKIYNIFVISNTPLHVKDASSEPLINTFISIISSIMGNYQITLCTFCNHIQVPAEFARKVNAEGNLTSWAAVLGLATYKLDIFGYKKDNMAINSVNLMPSYQSIIRSRAAQIISSLVMAALFAVVLTISIATLVAVLAQGYSLAGSIKTLEPVKAEYEGRNHELQQLSVAMDKVKSLSKLHATLPSNQAQIINIYKAITSSIPEGAWLSDVSFSQQKAIDSKDASSPKEYIAEIHGNATDDQNILEFVKKLGEAGGFRKVSIKTMEAIDKKDQTPTNSATASSSVKKFTLLGELEESVGIKKLELLTSGAK
jgi:type IV pilus assembly protein PilN